jgi:hypothetical protein
MNEPATNGSARLRPVMSFHTTHNGGLIAGDVSGWVDLTFHPAGGPTLVSIAGREIEVPPGWPLFDHLLIEAMSGAVTYLTRDGRRLAAVVPADVAESMLQEPADGDADDPPPLGPPRTLDELRREQGIDPVTDPASLRGEELADFDQFLAAMTSARPL